MEDNTKTLKALADEAYFNGDDPIMSDNEYDRLYGDYTSSKVGCLPPLAGRVTLPVRMASLTKHNDDKSLSLFSSKWKTVSFFNVQEKLDGVSCLYVHDDKGQVNLYTRGDGTIGTDITHLIKYGLNVPFKCDSFLMVRGELIISKKIFKEMLEDAFKNTRNTVSGQVVAKKPNADVVKYIDFVAYEIVNMSQFQPSVEDQHQQLIRNGFKVVYNRNVEKKLVTKSVLTNYLNRRKNKSEYDIDGLVLTVVTPYTRSDLLENPKYSVAFKIRGETAETTVVQVKWNLSKNGKYKPRIVVEPTQLSGVTISSVTGFNAKYIVDNRVVPGTKIVITRSGDVIPHIVSVEKSDEGSVTLPENSLWNSVDLYHNQDSCPNEVVIKQMVYFFSSLKCANCKDKTITKIFNAGFKDVEAVIQACVFNNGQQLQKIDGLGDKLAAKISVSVVDNLKAASLHELLAALNAFGEGIGFKKIVSLNLTASSIDQQDIKGISKATIKEKVLPVLKASLDRVKNIKKMVDSNYDTVTLQQTTTVDSRATSFCGLSGQIFVFTGFRDQRLEKVIVDHGGRVTTAVSKKTTAVVVDHNWKPSSKTVKAQSINVPLMTRKDLEDKLDNLPKTPMIDVEQSDLSEEEM
jgi:NAD-dependent DNA ligase